MLQHVPNVLSISRIALAPTTLALALHLTFQTYVATVCVASAALLTDFLDGYLARRWNVSSAFGYVMDGLGDRAMHLALLLAFMTRYGVNPLLVWLITFREIGVYAVRSSNTSWLGGAKSARMTSYIYVSCFRVWLGLFLLRDGVRVTTGADILSGEIFDVAQYALLASTIIVSYYGLFLNLRRPRA